MSKNRNEDVRIGHFEKYGVLYAAAAVLAVAALYTWKLPQIYDYLEARTEFNKVAIGSRGQFGDSFGALTAVFSALSFSAVLVTLLLQIQELRGQRIAANDQLLLQERYQNLRIRPVIKAEWFPLIKDDAKEGGKYKYELRIRNVGPGAAILDSIRPHWAVIRTVEGEDMEQAKWKEVIDRGMQKFGMKNRVANIAIDNLDSNNCALGPGEAQRHIRVGFKEAASAFPEQAVLNSEAIPAIYFLSLVGKLYNSETQFKEIRDAADTEARPSAANEQT